MPRKHWGKVLVRRSACCLEWIQLLSYCTSLPLLGASCVCGKRRGGGGASDRSLTVLSFSPDSVNPAFLFLRLLLISGIQSYTVEQVKRTAGLPGIAASVPCGGICFQESLCAELVGTDKAECTNPLILTPAEEGGAERRRRQERLVSCQPGIPAASLSQH